MTRPTPAHDLRAMHYNLYLAFSSAAGGAVLKYLDFKATRNCRATDWIPSQCTSRAKCEDVTRPRRPAGTEHRPGVRALGTRQLSALGACDRTASLKTCHERKRDDSSPVRRK